MNLRLLAVLGLWLACSAAPARAADAKPNILFLLADDWRWDTLGCAGNAVVKTPNLDALAAHGTRFTQCRVTTSICCVSRASILTGQHMARHGVDRFGLALEPNAFAQTYPALLRASGYWTGFVGKYGVGKIRPADFDFQRQYEGKHWLPDGNGGTVHVTEKNARDSLAFLADRPREKPFCLSVSFFATHAEDKAPEQYLPQPWSAKFYEGVTIPVPKTATPAHTRALPPFLAADANEGRVRWKKRFDTPEKYQRFMTNYYRLATELDEAVGRLMAELKKQGVYDNTLIVFTGDNGYFHGEFGLADKWYPYEEALRVPLIVCDPRLPKKAHGTTTDALTLNIDLAPTLLAAAGVNVPERMQGRDLSPLYLAPTTPPWRTVFYYQHPTITSKDRIPSSEAVVRRESIFGRYPEFDYEHYFNLNADPGQETNLAQNPALARRMRARREELAALRESAK